MKKNLINNEIEAKDVIAKSGYETPSSDFTSSIMQTISDNPLTVRNDNSSILPAHFWSLFISAIFLITGAVIFISLTSAPLANHEPNGLYSSYIKIILNEMQSIVNHSQIPAFVPIVFLSMFIIAFADFLFMKNKKYITHKN